LPDFNNAEKRAKNIYLRHGCHILTMPKKVRKTYVSDMVARSYNTENNEKGAKNNNAEKEAKYGCFRHGCQILTMPKKGEKKIF
jgi:hypothetical protein